MPITSARVLIDSTADARSYHAAGEGFRIGIHPAHILVGVAQETSCTIAKLASFCTVRAAVCRDTSGERLLSRHMIADTVVFGVRKTAFAVIALYSCGLQSIHFAARIWA
jgi:hypothetical protein